MASRPSPRGTRSPVRRDTLWGAIVLQYALDYPHDVGGLILVGTGAKLRVAPHVLEAIEKGIKNPDRSRTSSERSCWLSKTLSST